MAKNRKPEIVGRLEEADAAAAAAVSPYRQTVPIRLLSWLSKAGDQPPLRTFCAAAIAAGLAGGNRRLAAAGARALASHTLATVLKDAVKHRVDRSRPRSSGDNKPKIKPGTNTAKEETSFPSGHSAGAAAVASAFAREFPEYAGPAYAAAGLIALAQVPRCSHYPSDVGAGLTIGIAADAALDHALGAVPLAGDGTES
ncbi:MAG TPA: phosphatase PAP2 family protein [Allosphingosinicella sp.]|jgi:membrane-associated phospholipid phosphatase